MASLYGLTIWLVCAGIFLLANSTTPAPLQCSYNVSAIAYGFQIYLMNSPNGNYRINIKEKDSPMNGQMYMVHSTNQNLGSIHHLKPCTEYEHSVTFIDSPDNGTSCTSTENETQTREISEGEVRDENCMPGYVCYGSDWNISSSLFPSKYISVEKCPKNSNVFCIKPGYSDICTDLTTTITSVNCLDSFKVSSYITPDFLDTSELTQTFPKELPVKIDQIKPLPPNCNHLTINYTCREKGKPNDSKDLYELEPFTDYTCIGQIKDNNVTIKNTTVFEFKVDCDLTINIEKSSTSTSIHLNWTTNSTKCQDVQIFSYNCTCGTHSNQKPIQAEKLPSGGKCDITGLEPYKDYTCEVQSIYKKEVRKRQPVTQKTAIGIPDDITSLSVTLPENNVIRVTCNPSHNFNGPGEKFKARLLRAGVNPMEADSKNCKFEFKDLSYSTEYQLEVTASNVQSDGKPWKQSVTTYYNDKALIGFLVFFVIIAFVTLVLAAYKINHYRKSKNDVRGDVMLKPTETEALYVNVPRYKNRHKDTL